MNEHGWARGWKRAGLSLLIGFLGLGLFPSKTWAIPAWTRQFDVPCSTCHYPAPPRLNAFGHKFRRAQFRREEDFNKDPDWREVRNYLALRVRGRYEYSDAENDPAGTSHTVSSTFRLNDATLFYAGPVTSHFSGFVELERPDEPEIEAVVSAGGIWGEPSNFWTFRLGQFHTLTRVGWGGFDRPTGISTPDALSRDLTSGASGFKINQDQIGLEGTYVRDNWRIIGQILNGARGDSSTVDGSDDNLQKDGVLAWELMWGDLASGLTAFYYRGKQDLDPTSDRLSLDRYGVSAAQVFDSGFEVQGGYVWAKDDFDSATLTDVDGEGYWLELEQYFEKAKNVTIFGRWDEVDPNKDVGDDKRSKLTIGAVWPVGGWHARWGLELRNTSQDTASGSLTTKEAVGELMLNF